MLRKDWTIRRAEAGDEQTIREIALASYEVYLERMDKMPAPMLADYGKLISEGSVFALEDASGCQGYAVLLDGPDDSLLLDNLAVSPVAQKKGYGKALLQFAEKEAKKLGKKSVTLYTNEAMVENLAWYPKHGFVASGRVQEKGYKRVWFKKSLAD